MNGHRVYICHIHLWVLWLSLNLRLTLWYLLLHTLSHNSLQDGKFAMGFSGDVEGGGKTAYDVLPPKPWKAAP